MSNSHFFFFVVLVAFLLVSVSDATTVKFLFFNDSILWTNQRTISVQTSLGLQSLKRCTAEGWYYRAVTAQATSEQTTLSATEPGCPPCSPVSLAFDGGFALITKVTSCGCGSLDSSFIPDLNVLGTCTPRVLYVYYHNSKWWSSQDAVVANFETGVGIGTVPLSKCSAEGWFYQALGSGNTAVGITFQGGANIDYAQCGKVTKYYTTFDGSALSISTTSGNCGGTVTTGFNPALAGSCTRSAITPTLAPTGPPPAPSSEGGVTPSSSRNLVLIMAAPAAALGVLIAMLATFLIVRRVRQKRAARARDMENSVPLKSGDINNNFHFPPSPMSAKHVSTGNTWVNTQYQVVTLPGYLLLDRQKQVQTKELMTKGGGGSIYFGKLLDQHLIYENDGSIECVVKDLKPLPSLSDSENKLVFQQEVSAMGALRNHPYVAKLLGFSEKPRSIVTPLYAGDLCSLIHSQDHFEAHPMDLTLDFLLRMVFQIADAMTVVHSLGVIHRDIKTKNILLEKTSSPYYPFRVKLSDFGICRIIDQSIKKRPSLNVFGISTRYAAPEIFGRLKRPEIELDAEDEKKADVYAFGVCVWEMFMRIPPWKGVSTEEVQQRVCAGKRPVFENLNHNNSDELMFQSIATDAWSSFPRDRPSFADILGMLVSAYPLITEAY